MMRTYRITYCLFFLFFLCTGVRGQSADSLKARLAILSAKWQGHLLKDTDYLRAMDSIVPFLEQEDSLPQWLTLYREIAFADPKPGLRHAHYYTYMALNAVNTNKLGSAIYYAEKNNEERTKAGLFEKGGIAHSEMFAFFVYLGDHDYHRIIQKYLLLTPALRAMSAGKVSPEQAYVAISIIQVAVFTYAQKGDTVRMDQAAQTARAILGKMREQPNLAGPYRAIFNYLDHSITFKVQTHRQPEQAARLLYRAIQDVRDTAFPEHMRADYSSGLYNEAVEFYSPLHKTDSVRHYLQLLQGIGANARESTTDMVFLAANEAFLLGDEGRYTDAYQRLRKAYALRDSAYYAVSTDKQNNLYALAEAENARSEMMRSEEKKRRAETTNLYLFFLLSLLVVAGGALFIVNRERQRQRLLNLQIGLARNFHDAVGPMLIYANALAKREMDDHPTERMAELKTHIGKIMEEVRGISHDLKSKQLGTVSDLARENTTLLEKLKNATGIGFSLRTENGNRALSHVQHTHLAKITQELIGNSVKHAGCSKINLEMKAIGENLQIQYSDDGKGMDPAGPPAGIGLQNIRERVADLRGAFLLTNTWPRGYHIKISIPLL